MVFQPSPSPTKSLALIAPRPFVAALFVAALELLRFGPADLLANEPTDVLRQPGIRAEYSPVSPLTPAAGSSVATQRIARTEAAPTLWLAPGEAPDSRLPATGWQARWTGVIEILQPGNYQFLARTSGPLRVRIAGKTAIEVSAEASKAELASGLIAGARLELEFGLHPLEVEFQSSGAGAELKLFWESEHFAREPLGARSVGHAVPETDVEAAAGAPINTDVVFASDSYLAGRLAVEEHSCVSCHRQSDAAPISASLAKRPGPHLTAAGDRLKEAWIYHWLGDPQHLRPEAVMPRLFAATRTGELERRAVAHFLTAQKNPAAKSPAEPPADPEQLVAQGKVLFERTGCIACHLAAPGRPARATLRGLTEKTTAACLAEFLRQPAKTDPAGRMPDLKLTADEAAALAFYLTDPKSEPIEPLVLPDVPSSDDIRATWLAIGRDRAALDAIAPQKQLSELGRQVMHERRCTTCHELKVPGEEEFWQPKPAKTDFAHVAARSADEAEPDCLVAPTDATISNDGTLVANNSHPHFANALNRAAVREFLAAARTAPGAAAPAEAARLALARFNCQACHERDGIGGLAPEFVNLLSANQSAQEAELVKPPTLSGITDKLLEKPLDEVLTGDHRSRPWMSIRMPHFGKEHVGHLASALAALEGSSAADRAASPEPDARLAEAGRQLVGAQGFGCTKCHDLLGRPSGGTRGPDLSQVPERIQYGWFQHWMTDPQRIEPGTRMPTVFLKGESPYPSILDGDPALQREAIWQYLLASRNLPLPSGFEPVASETAPAGDRVLVARTFLSDVSARSMAIRFPSAVHLVFDAQSCRLAHAWKGDFLDMTPVWTERGGRQARLQSPIRWHSPGGFPWEISAADSTDLPSFAGRATDPSLGAPLPDDAQLHPSRLRFRGYHADAKGATFRYDLELSPHRLASFSERLATSADASSGRILRGLEIATPEAAQVTIHVAESGQPPQVLLPGECGPRSAADAGAETAGLAGDAILLITDEPGAAIYRLHSSATKVRWRVAERDGRWHLCVQLPTVVSPVTANTSDPKARANLSLEVVLPTDGSPEGVSRLIETLRRPTGQ